MVEVDDEGENEMPGNSFCFVGNMIRGGPCGGYGTPQTSFRTYAEIRSLEFKTSASAFLNWESIVGQ